MDFDEPVLLGAELAAAQQREMEHHRRHRRASPLQDVRYEQEESRLWRWVDAAADLPVTHFVERYRSLPAYRRRRTRARLRQQDFYTLILFARRAALRAIRTGDAVLVRYAYDALSAVVLDRVDWRDVCWAAAVVGHAAQQLGLSAPTLAAGAVANAEGETAAVLRDKACEWIDLAGDWGLREVDTGTGPVLLDNDAATYDPQFDLAGMATALADAFEADRYSVTGVTITDSIPAIWLNDYQARGLEACVSVSAHLRDSAAQPMQEDMLLAFLAQMQTRAHASAVVDAANSRRTPDSPSLTAASGRVCTVLIARSVVHGKAPVEDLASLRRFDQRLRSLLPHEAP